LRTYPLSLHDALPISFGMILHSRDSGATWEPWIERTANERRMHRYGLAERHGVFYASGEQGLLMRLDLQAQRFVALDSGYGGTLDRKSTRLDSSHVKI